MSNQNMRNTKGTATAEPATESEQPEGIMIRVLPCCGKTLLQITVTLAVRSVGFAHPDHGSTLSELCTHIGQPGKALQAVLKDGDQGMLALDVAHPFLPTENCTISFRVLDLELREIKNPSDLPLTILVVL